MIMQMSVNVCNYMKMNANLCTFMQIQFNNLSFFSESTAMIDANVCKFCANDCKFNMPSEFSTLLFFFQLTYKMAIDCFYFSLV